MRTMLLTIIVIIASVGINPKAQADFYDSYLVHAIDSCYGFVGGSKQLEIDTTYTFAAAAYYRYKSTCYEPLLNMKTVFRPLAYEAKTGGPGETPMGPEDVPEGLCRRFGSFIDITSGNVGEKIPIAGAPFDLIYFTERTPGLSGLSTIRIPIFDSNPAVTGYRIEATYAGGRVLNQTFNNIPGQYFNFQWDGLDIDGNVIPGSIKFDYKVIVKTAGKEIPINYHAYLGSIKAEIFGFGYWTPSIYHFYDIERGRLMSGDGTSRLATPIVLANGDRLVAKADASEVYVFDNRGFLKFTKFGLSGATKFEFQHDANGYLKAVVQPYGKHTQFNIVGGKVTSIISNGGQVTTLVYNAAGGLSRVTGPDHGSYKIDYQANKLISHFAKPEGQVNSFTYDEDGHLKNDYHSSGFYQDFSLKFEYHVLDRDGPVSRLKSRMGVEQVTTVKNTLQSHRAMDTISQNARGQIIKTLELNNSMTSIYPTYTSSRSFNEDFRFPESARYVGFSRLDINGTGAATYQRQFGTLSDPGDPFSISNLRYETQIRSKKVISDYDGISRVWTRTSAEGRQVRRQLNAFEQTVQSRIGKRAPVNYIYDSSGNVSEITQGNRKNFFEYDANNEVIAIVDPLGNRSTLMRDVNGRIVSSSAASGRRSQIKYDKNGNIIEVTPPGREAHNFLQTSFEEVAEYLPPAIVGIGRGSTKYFYNRDNQLAKVNLPDGRGIVYDYGVIGKVTSVITSSGSYSYLYDSATDQVGYASSPYGISSTFNFKGPFTIFEDQVVTSSPTAVLRFQLDDENRILNRSIEIASPLAKESSTFSYDKDDLVVRIGKLSLLRETDTGEISDLRIGNLNLSFLYDLSYGQKNSSVLKIGNSAQEMFSLDRDSLGRIVRERTGGRDTSYSYDRDGRLLSSRSTMRRAFANEYSYDDNGNRILTKSPNGLIAASYDEQDRIVSWGSKTYAHNLNGQLISETDSSTGSQIRFTYDSFGNLNRVDLPNSSFVEYRYDAFNRRVVRSLNGVTLSRFVYDGQLKIVGEIDGSNILRKVFYYGDSPNVPDYMIVDGVNYLLVKDSRGSVIKVVSDKGVTIQEISYDDWGLELSNSNPGFQPFGFGGGVFDRDTRLVHFGARDYNPETGRWTTKDPIRFKSGEMNLYGYAISDPINFIDPNGKDSIGDAIDGLKDVLDTVGDSVGSASDSATNWIQERNAQIRDYLNSLGDDAQKQRDTIKDWFNKNLKEFEDDMNDFGPIRRPSGEPSKNSC